MKISEDSLDYCKKGAFQSRTKSTRLSREEKSKFVDKTTNGEFVMVVNISRLGQVVLVTLSGKLEIEKMSELRKLILSQARQEKIIVCFREIGFVGSYGITALFQILQEAKDVQPQGVKLSGLSRDFSFLMDSMGYQFEKHTTIDSALRAYNEVFSKAA